MPRRLVHPLPAAFETPSNLPLFFERLADTFTPRPGLEPFRLPVSPRCLSDLFPAFDEDEDGLDYGEILARLHPQALLDLDWSSCGLSSCWGAFFAVLRDRRRLYFDGSNATGPQMLAVAPPDFTRATGLLFLDLLAGSNGETFGTGVISGAPSGVDCDRIPSRAFMVDLFLQLFDASGAWEGDDIDVGDPTDYACLWGDEDVDPDDEAAHSPTPDPLLTPETLSPADERLYRPFAEGREGRWRERLQDVRRVEIHLRRRWRE